MSFVHFALILLFLIFLAMGITIIVKSKPIAKWIWNWGIIALHKMTENEVAVPKGKSQYESSIWIIRFGGFLLSVVSILGLYQLFANSW